MFTGVVCDTQPAAEKYIGLVNSGVSYDDVWRLTNAGNAEPVCGILRIAYYPLRQMNYLRLRSGYVFVHEVMMVHEDAKLEMRWMIPGVKRYIIKDAKTDPA